MATKKQKREAALAKRERMLAEVRESGLKALREDRERRENLRRKQQQPEHDKKKHSWEKRDLDCIICRDALRAQRAQET